MIQVTPTKAESVNEFMEDPKDFRTFDPSEPPGLGYQGYVNEEEGFVLQVFNGNVKELVYLPSKGDQPPCAGYYLNPEEFVHVFIHPPISLKFDEYGALSFSDEKVRLDNFAIQLKAQSTGRGVIIIYAGRKAMVAEAKTRANRVKDYLVRNRGIKGSRLEVIDGGYRESLTVELFIANQGEPSPTPQPTVDPSQVEIMPVRKSRPRTMPHQNQKAPKNRLEQTPLSDNF